MSIIILLFQVGFDHMKRPVFWEDPRDKMNDYLRATLERMVSASMIL
jgi:hypothetical protein